jgi:hypothetical protein
MEVETEREMPNVVVAIIYILFDRLLLLLLLVYRAVDDCPSSPLVSTNYLLYSLSLLVPFPSRRTAYISNPCLLRLIRDQGILTINGTESLPIPNP